MELNVSPVAREVTPIEVDRPGALSILLQGALLRSNLVMTANHCAHWRRLFPHAQIVVAFNEPVNVESLGQITLQANGSAVPPRPCCVIG